MLAPVFSQVLNFLLRTLRQRAAKQSALFRKLWVPVRSVSAWGHIHRHDHCERFGLLHHARAIVRRCGLSDWTEHIPLFKFDLLDLKSLAARTCETDVKPQLPNYLWCWSIGRFRRFGRLQWICQNVRLALPVHILRSCCWAAFWLHSEIGMSFWDLSFPTLAQGHEDSPNDWLVYPNSLTL